jgi:hypothetical protein
MLVLKIVFRRSRGHHDADQDVASKNPGRCGVVIAFGIIML